MTAAPEVLRALAAERWDAIVVGSGAGGGAASWRLAKAGLRVLVLERGAEVPERDVVPDEVASCRRDLFVPSVATDPHVLVDAPGAPPRRTHEGWTAVCVGGGTRHMGATLLRMHPEDFDSRTRWGRPAGTSAADWPVGYETLRPFYDLLTERLPVAGRNGANPFEPPGAPFLEPPVAVHPAAESAAGAARARGLHPYPAPRGIVTVPREGRRPCVQCGYCALYACPVDARATSVNAFLADPAVRGRLRLVAGARVVEVGTGPDGRAAGVAVADRDGAVHAIRAPVVVLAASSVETARLLLLSRSARHPDGLGNAAGQVGRHLVVSLDMPGRATFPFPSDLFPESSDRLPFLDVAVQDLYLDAGAPGPWPKSGTLLFGRAHFNPIQRAENVLRGDDPRGRPLLGPALVERVRRAFLEEREIVWECFVEMLPGAEGRVTLDPDVVDSLGLPAARIALPDLAGAAPRAERLASLARDVLGDLRPAPTSVHDPRALRPTTFLQGGTCRMGTDPDESAADPGGQVWGVPGLYVADGAALPTLGAVPPTLTILANALRIAEAIVAARSQ